MSSVETESASIQYAALPWRLHRSNLEILLLTTLNTRRWIIPKGWPLPGLAPNACAAREAFEEGGVEGHIAERPLGAFRYDKRRKSGNITVCRVDVFALEVLRQRRNWPEKNLRQVEWCPVSDAAARVTEAGLERLIVKFAKAIGGLPAH